MRAATRALRASSFSSDTSRSLSSSLAWRAMGGGSCAVDEEATLVWSMGHFAGPDEAEVAEALAAEWSIGHDAGAEGAADIDWDAA